MYVDHNIVLQEARTVATMILPYVYLQVITNYVGGTCDFWDSIGYNV